MKNKKPKERVLETASELFKKQGFNSTGINQIVKEAKVAKASFYDHFPSKDELAIHYLQQRHTQWFEGLQNFVDKVNSKKDKIIQAFEYLKYMNEKEDFSGCVFLNMLSELKYEQNDAYLIIKNHKQDVRNFFHNLIDSPILSMEIYLLFEACLVESQVFRTQEIIHNAITIIQQKEF
ncbi:TetR/AcrR family transcriptional regulator [Ornithobacterium rhinotracheale]|uniref:TetR/AcrR family transcriptional regulator n=1 Tax=Ornithobacterium rhinotracheale TaxID=28251 RepID=A0A3R5YX75_ORNRH|nr:TetR/AcrR family transcriptional regulator [Ornithobacterium rhinotracheale]QAR31659.1 TetR/AcrR family transcriptional regulator [Ornithobacterium rhinotracheale]